MSMRCIVLQTQTFARPSCSNRCRYGIKTNLIRECLQSKEVLTELYKSCPSIQKLLGSTNHAVSLFSLSYEKDLRIP
jgi:hypothetical protein